MNSSLPRLPNAPIVEAVVDIDCDMPPSQDIATLEAAARERFLGEYPNVRKQFFQELMIAFKGDGPSQHATQSGIRALQFSQQDGKQLVQVRAQGYSFNRLRPYTNLDDYLPEIERTWRLFVGVASPLQVRQIRLRYINRILLPLEGERVNLDDYLQIGPQLPDEERLTFLGFLNQYTAVEAETGNRVTINLATQKLEQGRLPLIFDIEAAKEEVIDPSQWEQISRLIQSLRSLKNLVFRKTLTDRCLELFQ